MIPQVQLTQGRLPASNTVAWSHTISTTCASAQPMALRDLQGRSKSGGWSTQCWTADSSGSLGQRSWARDEKGRLGHFQAGRLLHTGHQDLWPPLCRFPCLYDLYGSTSLNPFVSIKDKSTRRIWLRIHWIIQYLVLCSVCQVRIKYVYCIELRRYDLYILVWGAPHPVAGAWKPRAARAPEVGEGDQTTKQIARRDLFKYNLPVFWIFLTLVV